MLQEIAAPLLGRRSAALDGAARGDRFLAPTEVIWRRLRWFSAIFAAGWMLALVFHGFIAPALGYGSPLDSFLLGPRWRYADLTQSWRAVSGFQSIHRQSNK